MIVDFSVKVVGYGISIFGQTSHAGEFVLLFNCKQTATFSDKVAVSVYRSVFNQKGI